MAHQIIKQPNGLYCVYSSIVDHFVLYNATIEEIIEEEVQSYRKRIEKDYRELAAKLDAGEKPYRQFTETFDEACHWIRLAHHGDKEGLDQLEAIIGVTTARPGA